MEATAEAVEARNRGIVGSIYEAFGRGAIDEILATFREDIELEPGLGREVAPWIRPGRGIDAAMAFFRTLGEQLQFEHFEPLRFFAAGDEIVVTLREHIIVRATGRAIHEDPAIHLWRLDDDGRVASFRHVIDTQQQRDALQPDPSREEATPVR